MALLSALFTALSRKVGDLVSALVGWSVGALFGQVSAKQRALVSSALILSLLWPVFIVGVFYPAVATYLLAFVPIEHPTVKLVLRTIWIVLSIASPAIVGLLVRAVSQSAHQKGVWSAIVHGYPMAAGFAASFIITVFTVPLVKLSSIGRGWADEHLYVQPKRDQYDVAVGDLCEACVWAGMQPRAAAVPRSMLLSTQVIKFFSKGFVDDLIVKQPKMVRAKGLELYLYPADLLLRGDKHAIARVRAMLGRSRLDRDAMLVKGALAQKLQNQLGELWLAIDRHEDVDELGDGLKNRLKTISEQSTKPGISWEEWVALDGIARRIEAVLCKNESVLDQVGAKDATDAASVVKRDQAQGDHAEKPSERVQRTLADAQRAGAIELIDAALDQARELVRLEVAMVKAEARREVKAAISSASLFGVAMLFAGTMFSILAVALVLVLGGQPLHALIVAAGCFGVGLIAALIGYGRLPKSPMQRTRDRLEQDVHQLKEHLA